jgi:hypothetical protein
VTGKIILTLSIQENTRKICWFNHFNRLLTGLLLLNYCNNSFDSILSKLFQENSKQLTIKSFFMRNAFLFKLVMLLPAMTILFNACKRENSQNFPDNKIAMKIKSWLDLQKPSKKPNKSANVEALKNNLDFSKARYEVLSQDKQLLIVPVLENFKRLKDIDQNTLPELLLILDRSGNIEKGNLVLYMPETGQTISQLPANTFHKIYNSKEIACDGKFRFLSPAGQWLYDYGYKDGKFSSLGEIKTREKSTTSRTNMCWDSYLVERTWVDGVLVSENWVYIGSFCDSFDCNDPNLQSICPDGEGVGGGGGGGGEECCIPDPSVQVLSEAVSENYSFTCGSESIDPITGFPTKVCTIGWVFNRNSLLFYFWKYKSLEQVTEQKEGGVWKFKSAPVHLGVNTEGTVPPCINTNLTITGSIPWISPDRMAIRMDIYYSQTMSIACIPGISGGSITTSDHAWGNWTPQ